MSAAISGPRMSLRSCGLRRASSAPSADPRGERALLSASRCQTATKDSLFAICCSPFVSSFLFSRRYSFPTRVVSFAAPGRGAGGAPVALGCLRGTRLGAPDMIHESAREHACDRRAVAPLDRKAVTAALRSLRTTAERGPRSISQTGRAGLREALAFPATGTLAFRRSTWDFWPGPVLAVVRHSLRDRAGNLICRTGHRYPEERVSRTSPGRPLTASGDTTASARLARTPLALLIHPNCRHERRM
jgi:hypothetical protein